MHVLHVDHSGLPGGGQLGLERYIRAPSEHRRTILFLSAGPVVDRLRTHGACVRLLDEDDSSTRAIIRYRKELKRVVEAVVMPDLVVANSLRAATALALANPATPLVYYARQESRRFAASTLTTWAAQKIVYRRFDGYIANTAWTLASIPEKVRDSKPTRVAYPISGAHGEGASMLHSRKPGAIRILWMGRLVPWKGLEVAMRAAALLADRGVSVSLSIAGAEIHEGKGHADNMRKLADRLCSESRADRLDIEFLGYVEVTDRLLEGHDVLVHTSIRPEPFGQVIVQGLAAGLVVLATRGGGPEEIITHREDGILYEAGDSEALASHLESIARNPDAYVRMRRAARVTASTRFSCSALVERLDIAITELAQEICLG